MGFFINKTRTISTMKFTAFAVLALIFVSSNATLSMTKVQHMKALAQINAHPLGEAIFAQVSIHMSAGQDYLADVVGMIDSLVGQLNDQQAAADAVHAQARATCDRLLPEYANNRDYNTQCADTCDQTVVDTQALLADAEEQLDATLAELASVNARIEAGQAQRDMEHAAWSELDAEHEAGVTACQDAINLVASMSRGALFIQLQGRIKSVSKRLSDMTHLNDKFTAYAPLINSFAQIASSSNNPQLLAQITSLITTLKNQIEATRAADAGWEDRKAAAWAKELADLTAQRDSLTERRNSLQAQILNYNNIIRENQEKSGMHRAEAVKFQYLLEQQTAWCNAEQAAYDEATNNRNEELSILGQVRDYISQRMGLAEEFIMA